MQKEDVNLMVKNIIQIKIWNNNKCRCGCKNPRKNVCDKSYVWNTATCNCENSRHAENVIEDSGITCDEILETTKNNVTKTGLTKSIPTNFSKKRV